MGGVSGVRECIRCGHSKRAGTKVLCTTCVTYIWRRMYPEKYKEQNKKNNDRAAQNGVRYKRHRITEAEYKAMLDSQDGKCAICRTDTPVRGQWHIDHDHACCPGGRSCGNCIRGLLCQLCNHMLGQAKDSPDILRKAIDYLEAS